ncbi:MAG: hypothetical protein RBT35_02170 [Bacteroidales bacterium]|jgi:hypothetical protein|nr:hypothetical protein [Bacteroidales bacterium]
MKRDDYKKIEALIEKYFNAETSLEEESIIKSYYKNTPQQEMPESLLVYKDMFGFFEAEKEYIESPKREYRSFYRPMLRWGTVAAAAILLITFFLINPGNEDSFRLIINGEKVNNSELAVTVANNRLDKVNSIMQQLSKANNTLNSVAKVEKALSPIEKMNATLTQNNQ